MDAINTRTIPIDEVAPLPESLQCESEPWTSFYRAGETIRELRKAVESEATAGVKAT